VSTTIPAVKVLAEPQAETVVAGTAKTPGSKPESGFVHRPQIHPSFPRRSLECYRATKQDEKTGTKLSLVVDGIWSAFGVKLIPETKRFKLCRSN
jgi:hypothetical protein